MTDSRTSNFPLPSFLGHTTGRILAVAALFQGAVLSPALAQLDQTPTPILPDLRYAAPLDLDGDGRDEIVGVRHTNDALVVYTLDRDGNATFDRRLAEIGSLKTRSYNRWTLELADMNGDGHDDIVQADGTDLNVFYGRGGSQFDERVELVPLMALQGFALLDLDSDGDMDVVTFPIQSTNQGVIRWNENLGGGAFASPVLLPSGADDYEYLEPVDIDGDGDLDLVGYHTFNLVPALVRNLGGGFQIEPIGGAIGGASDIETEDVDNDGLLDLLVRQDFQGGSTIELYRGAPGGFLTPTVVLDSTELLVGELAFANVDGVGGRELICQAHTSVPVGFSIRAFQWSSQGTFVGPLAQVNLRADESLTGMIHTADFDGNSQEDLMIRVLYPRQSPSLRRPFGPQAFLGSEDFGMPALEGPFRVMEYSPVGVTPAELYFAGDFDGDGITDLVQSRQGDLVWQRGSAGSVRFGLPERISDGSTIELISDLNGDGLPEIVLSESSAGGPQSVSVVQSLGGGAFGIPLTVSPTIPASENLSLRAYDFDQDGDLDLLPAPDSNYLFWFENMGGLGFASQAPLGVNSPTPLPYLHAGDFNGDGTVDLLETSFGLGPTELGWFEGLSAGGFGQRQALVPATFTNVAVIDVNEDGVDDVVYSDADAGATFALIGGPGGLGAGGVPVRLFDGEFFGTTIELIDLNGDGFTDFTQSRRAIQPEPQLAYLRIAPLAFDSTPIVVAPIPVSLHDFGGDGDLDGLGSMNDFEWGGEIHVIHEGLTRGISGTSYCGPATVNSSGSPASLLALGTSNAQLNELRLRVADAAQSSFGFFLASPVSQVATPVVGSAGLLCLGGAIGRYVGPGQVQATGATGSFALGLDVTAIPTPLGPTAAIPGATWYFQAWFRDFGPSGPTSNFTDGVEVTFE